MSDVIALSVEQIVKALPLTLRKVWQPIVLTTTDSTHADLSQAARNGASSGSVLLAEEQRAGRGRGGKPWFSPLGAQLPLTLIWRLDLPTSNLSGLSLMTGLSAITALEQMGLKDIQLKWPNDLYWNDRKLGGILVEIQGNPANRCTVVVSIGINVTTTLSKEKFENIDPPLVDCYTILDEILDRNLMAAHFLTAWHSDMERFLSRGLESFMERWRQYDYLYGHPVTMRLNSRSITGRAVGIDPTGALLVETDSGIERCYSADVERCRTLPYQTGAYSSHQETK
jgi:BirA family biotin operon repressor/biotin-[acetyl-CoA-carboxylase] ligase